MKKSELRNLIKEEIENLNGERLDIKNNFVLSKIDNIVFDGIDTSDYPDFTDAFILSADYEGEKMSDEELDKLNQYGDFVHERLLDSLI